MKDKLIASGTNAQGVKWEVFKDSSIGDFYLVIEDSIRPSCIGTKSMCLAAAKSWEK